MYKIVYLHNEDDLIHIMRYNKLYFYSKLQQKLVNHNICNIWREHALGAEEFIKKWLEYNKEWL